jgi:UDP-N-acetylmuramoyl-L-alanyl-D-glutamate--2,6-diaminopimelate ligase
MACALLSAAVVGQPASRLTLVGVTGTNGKTTVVSMLAEILEAAGMATTVVGTLTGARTTPPAPELHRLLAQAEDVAIGLGRRGAVAMEVSSHALDQDRVAGLGFNVAVFTNLSHDHLDYHGDMGTYFEAKARLFDDERTKVAVVWAETDEGRAILSRRQGSSIPVGWADAAELEVGGEGSRFVWRGQEVLLGLLGRINVIDALLAAEAAVVLGVEPAEVADSLRGLTPVRGRMERVGGGAGSPLVLVDYAHTPDALEGALAVVRQIAGAGKVLVVFGCGGDRDAAKRSLMGRAASEAADLAIITTDNPRHEDPSMIAAAVLSGATGPAEVLEIPERAEAIRRAIALAAEDDVVLIAGKGHETTQDFADRSIPFDDREVAAAALTERTRG